MNIWISVIAPTYSTNIYICRVNLRFGTSVNELIYTTNKWMSCQICTERPIHSNMKLYLNLIGCEIKYYWEVVLILIQRGIKGCTIGKLLYCNSNGRCRKQDLIGSEQVIFLMPKNKRYVIVIINIIIVFVITINSTIRGNMMTRLLISLDRLESRYC